MKKKDNKQKYEDILNLYQNYKMMKSACDTVSKKKMPQLTLDQKIENINPFYVRSEVVKYGR